MRISIVQETVERGRGGAETSTVEMARHLAQLGIDVTVIHRAATDTPSVEDNVTYLPVAVERSSRAMRTYRFVQGAQRMCRREQFDIVQAITPCLAANLYQPRGGTYAETVARTLAISPWWLRGAKGIGRRFNIRQRFLMRMERLLLGKYADRVHVAAISHYVRCQVAAQHRIDEERVRVVFNGVDVEPLSAEEVEQARSALPARYGLDEEQPLVLFVAHNFRLKGLRELLRAAAAQVGNAPRWQIVVAGRDRPEPYRQFARHLGIAGRVKFVGTEEPIRAWYAAADVLAHPTWYDPCSRVVLEALSLGLPVVTTRYNGAAEVMEARRHGVVIEEPRDAAALADAIDSALEPAVRHACRADAGRMRENVSMARHARELLGFYEDIISGRV